MPAGLARGRQPGAVAVFAALASYADNTTGDAHPSLLTLAHDIGVSRSTLERNLRWLREEGWVRWQVRSTRFGRQRFYTIWTPTNGMGGRTTGDTTGRTATLPRTRPIELDPSPSSSSSVGAEC